MECAAVVQITDIDWERVTILTSSNTWTENMSGKDGVGGQEVVVVT